MKKLIILAITLLTACAVGPNFTTPKVEVPKAYIHNMDQTNSGNLTQWWSRFDDPILDTLIKQAFASNRTLATAVANIEIARLQVATARATTLPSLAIGGSAQAKYSYDTKIDQSYSVMPSISWDIDLWGKIKREVEAQGASFHATEYQAAAVMQTLVAQLATTYFTAISYRNALQISISTYASRQGSQQLMDSMYNYGAISRVDLEQSLASLATAGATVEQYRRALEQSTLALNLLLGENPRSITLGNPTLTKLDIPVGLPSSLLERRPDVMQAYYDLKGANAMIGVAIANRLPSLSLTGEGGLATSIVADVATSRPIAWSGALNLLAPILNWGTLRRNEQIARIKTQQTLLAYEESVLGAINEVEQALVSIDTYRRELKQSIVMVNASQTAQRLTTELYKSGNASYLDLLDAERTLFAAQLQYVQTSNSQISSYINLYKALGGGW